MRRLPLPLQLFLPACLALAAALALAIVLALAGVLGKVWRRSLSHEEHARIGRSGSCSRTTLLHGLSVEAGSGPTKKTRECRRECKVVCSIDFHQEYLSLFGSAHFVRRTL